MKYLMWTWVYNREIGRVVGPPDKDIMEQLLIERRLRNATDVVADSNEGTVIGKERRSKVAQICGRTGCLLFVVCCLFAPYWSPCNFWDIQLVQLHTSIEVVTTP